MLRSACAASLFLAAAPVFAQANTFNLLQDGKPVGKDTYTLTQAKNTWKLSSRTSYGISGQTTSLADDFKLDANYSYQDGGINNLASQQHFSYSPNKQRTSLSIATIQGGQQDAHDLAIKPGLIVLPNWDAGAAQAALLMAVTHPADKNMYSVFVPSIRSAAPIPGSQDVGAGGGSGNFAYDAVWGKGEDTTGTLDGASVPVHVYTLRFSQATWTFYADDSNKLLQVDNTIVHGSCVRAGFRLAGK